MEMKLLVLFVVMNVVNVVIQTIKSIATIKCGKTAAAIVNAIAYGLYTYIVVLTMCDLPMFTKCIIVAMCNFIGVWVVKYGEEKARKDKLWKVEATVNPLHLDKLKNIFEKNGIPFSYIDVSKYVIFNLYCATQKDSLFVKSVLDQHSAKYFVSESKTL